MVITQDKNWSPDMILTAFEGKFDEKTNMKYLPGFVDLICFKIFSIRNLRADIKHKHGHNSGPRGSPMARIWHAPSYHTPEGFSKPKGPQFSLKVLNTFGGVIKMHNPINRAPVYFL